ncbi:MAG: hypothetical protein JJ975_12790 [Bacteroidia bacterium]|nr:hypothetical protein [Bacteroidia bacterium]
MKTLGSLFKALFKLAMRIFLLALFTVSKALESFFKGLTTVLQDQLND